MTEIISTALRTLLILLTLLIITRILGRRTLSELTFYDFVIGLIIGNVGSSVIVEEFGMRDGIITLIIATSWVLAINTVSLQSIPARKLIEAEPLMVLYKGKILENNLKKRYYNVNDLLEMLREQGTFDPRQVDVALIEPDGRLSVLKKPECQNSTVKDSNLQNQETLPASRLAGKELIIDGKFMKEALIQSGMTIEALEEQLALQGVTKISDVLLAMITPEGKLYVDKKQD